MKLLARLLLSGWSCLLTFFPAGRDFGRRVNGCRSFGLAFLGSQDGSQARGLRVYLKKTVSPDTIQAVRVQDTQANFHPTTTDY